MPYVKCDACTECRGLSLSGCQVPTKPSLSLLSANDQETENITKGSWVEKRTGREIIHQFPYWAKHI